MLNQRTKNSLQLILISALLIGHTQAWAQDSELGYDEIVSELSQKSSNLQPVTTTSRTAPMRLGLGYTNSFSNFAINGKNYSRTLSGVKLKAGFEFSDPRFLSEFHFSNFGVASQGDETMSMREAAAQIGFQEFTDERWAYSLMTGLAQRNFKFESRSVNRLDENSSSLIITTGASARMLKQVFVGFDVSLKSALESQVSYRNAVDFGLHVTSVID